MIRGSRRAAAGTGATRGFAQVSASRPTSSSLRRRRRFPGWPSQSRCALPVLAPWPLLDGPFTKPLWQWRPVDPAYIASCIHAARLAVDAIGNGLGNEAINLFESLGGSLDSRLELARAFSTLALRADAESLGICSEPAAGMAQFGGADDAPTRINRWKPLGLWSLGLEQGVPNRKDGGCHGAKRQLLGTLFGSLPNRWVVAKKLPAFAQLGVLRIGNRLIGVIPAEATTTAGSRMRALMLAAAHQPGSAADTALILGLANGYVGYVTTSEEYAAQYYEGGLPIYGPGEAAMFGRALAGLTAALSTGDVLPPGSSPTLKLDPGAPRAILRPERAAAPAPAGSTESGARVTPCTPTTGSAPCRTGP